MNSTDKTHGKAGHLCSTLCGAAMFREQRDIAEYFREDGQYTVEEDDATYARFITEVRSSDTYTVGDSK